MCMPMQRRLQLLLDDERYTKLAAVARSRGTSVSAVIREAIDRGVRGPDEQRAAAGRRILDAQPMPVPDVDDLLAELDAARARRS